MSLKKTLNEYTPAEIADALVLPVKLTAKQKQEAQRQLAEHRAKRKAEMTGEEKLQLELMQLKFRLEDYIKGDQYDPEFTFGYFLEQYLQLNKKKKKEFARDIQIHETLLSQIIKNRREPNNSFIIRLELHSNNAIPAIDWLKLIEKEKEHTLRTDVALRKRESQYVIGKLQLIV
jgi:hypothetical protein